MFQYGNSLIYAYMSIYGFLRLHPEHRFFLAILCFHHKKNEILAPQSSRAEPRNVPESLEWHVILENGRNS